ncbi:MAG: uracil phosphoribosyltransferase [Planctomycetota bacterium]|nr:MAG: uracil phosphoribosyltransferase [Planctomycetota bacterium]
MGTLHLCRHPLVADALALLRDRDCPPEAFRRQLRRLALVLGQEAAAGLRTTPIEVRTPLAPCRGERLAGRLALVPVLRAGLGLVEGLLDLLPEAEVWHLGLFRDEATLEPVEYYSRLGGSPPPGDAFLLDPMLATGGTAVAAVAALRRWGVERIRFVGVLGAPAGVEALQRHDPGVEIHLAALDPELDERGYILPGLGDAGDRQYRTGS